MFKKILKRNKKNFNPRPVQSNGGLNPPPNLEQREGSVPAIVYRVKKGESKRLFFAHPPRRDIQFYSGFDSSKIVVADQTLVPVQYNRDNFILYGQGLESDTEILARKFYTAEGIERPDIMQVISFKRKGAGQPDMPETNDEIEAINVGYMFKDDLDLDNQKEEFIDIPKEQPIFSKLPEINDIKQSWMGDCFLLASLNAILNVDLQVDHLGNPIEREHSGADFIENMMIRDGDNIIIRLYDRRTLKPKFIRIRAAHHYKNGQLANSHNADWPAFIENAYADLAMISAGNNKLGLNIDNDQIIVTVPAYLTVFGAGGQIKNAMSILTGMEATSVQIKNNLDKYNPFNGNDIALLSAKLTNLATDLLTDVNYNHITSLANQDALNKNFNNFKIITTNFKNEILKNEATINWLDENIRNMLFAKILGYDDKNALRELGIYLLVLQFFYPATWKEMNDIFKTQIKSRKNLEEMLTNIITKTVLNPPDFPELPPNFAVKYCEYIDSAFKAEEILVSSIEKKNPNSFSLLTKLSAADNEFKNFSKISKVVYQGLDSWKPTKIYLFGVFESLNKDVELLKKWGVYLYTLKTYYPHSYTELQSILDTVPRNTSEVNTQVAQLENFIPKIPIDIIKKIRESSRIYYSNNKISQFAGSVGSGQYTIEDFQLFDDLNKLLQSGSIVAAGTIAEFDQKVPGLRPSHAYTITKVEKKKIDKKELMLITLRNPWNAVGRCCDFSKDPVEFTEEPARAEFQLDLTDFKQYFNNYTFGKLPTKQKLELELQQENENTFKNITESKSFGLMSALEKKTWINLFLNANINKQIRDSHLLHQLEADVKNIWEIARAIQLKISSARLAFEAKDAIGNSKIIESHKSILEHVLSFGSSLISKQTVKKYDTESYEYFRKGYKNYGLHERESFIARLLITKPNLNYLLKDQGIDDLYCLIFDVKTILKNQKLELKDINDKQCKKYFEQVIQAENSLLNKLKYIFKGHMEFSPIYSEMIRLHAEDYKNQKNSFIKSFVRTVKSIFKHSDEDKMLKAYSRHLKLKNLNEDKQIPNDEELKKADETANREYILNRIKHDKISIVNLASEYLADLGKDTFINKNIELFNELNVEKNDINIKINKTVIHTEDGDYYYKIGFLVKDKFFEIKNCTLNDLHEYAITQYKELIWNNTFILSKISEHEKLELIQRRLGLNGSFSATEELCRLTDAKAKNISNIKVNWSKEEAVEVAKKMEINVTFKDKSTQTLSLLEADINRYAVTQYREEYIEKLKKPKPSTRPQPR